MAAQAPVRVRFFNMRTAQALYSDVWLILSNTGLVNKFALFQQKCSAIQAMPVGASGVTFAATLAQPRPDCRLDHFFDADAAFCGVLQRHIRSFTRQERGQASRDKQGSCRLRIHAFQKLKDKTQPGRQKAQNSPAGSASPYRCFTI